MSVCEMEFVTHRRRPLQEMMLLRIPSSETQLGSVIARKESSDTLMSAIC